MSLQTDQLRGELRAQLSALERRLVILKDSLDEKAHGAEKDVRKRLTDVQKTIEQSRRKMVGAQADVKKWLDEQKTVTAEKIASWKKERKVDLLRRRADLAERYAAAAIAIALATTEEAEQAVLEAALARKDALLA